MLRMTNIKNNSEFRIEVAPMMGYTHRHFRYLARLFSPNSLLYTEMVTTAALLHTRQAAPEKWRRYLDFHPAEHPLVLQLGGSCPHDLAECARMAEQWGYDAVNLNVGCPSERVQSGLLGAVLFRYPETVRDCLSAMRAAVSIPVTIKTRLGVDHQDSYEDMLQFMRTVCKSGVSTWVIHARKAWLHGLSPKENRHIPPLQPERVLRIKQDFPDLTVILNGGITTVEGALSYRGQVDGVMLGRAVMRHMAVLSHLEHALITSPSAAYTTTTAMPAVLTPTGMHALLTNYIHYAGSQYGAGVPVSSLIAPLLSVFHGKKGAKQWRSHWTQLGNQMRKQLQKQPGQPRDAGQCIAQLMTALHTLQDLYTLFD